MDRRALIEEFIRDWGWRNAVFGKEFRQALHELLEKLGCGEPRPEPANTDKPFRLIDV
jgi:hypothetical protein